MSVLRFFDAAPPAWVAGLRVRFAYPANARPDETDVIATVGGRTLGRFASREAAIAAARIVIEGEQMYQAAHMRHKRERRRA